MATVETVIGEFGNGRVLLYFNQTGPASYAAGGVPITINTLRTVEQILDVSNDGGFRVVEQEARNTLSTNTFKIIPHYEAFACPGTSSGGTLAGTACSTGFVVNAGVNLSAVTFSGIVTGF